MELFLATVASILSWPPPPFSRGSLIIILPLVLDKCVFLGSVV